MQKNNKKSRKKSTTTTSFRTNITFINLKKTKIQAVDTHQSTYQYKKLNKLDFTIFEQYYYKMIEFNNLYSLNF